MTMHAPLNAGPSSYPPTRYGQGSFQQHEDIMRGRDDMRPADAENEMAVDDMEDESDAEMAGGLAADGTMTVRVRPGRRRSRKGMDKKYDCTEPGCGKSYSRAEHLYRHNLNHKPKEIYHCLFPECHRSFVRQDLRQRHQERHTNKGSQLQKKDAFQNGLAVKEERKSSIGKSSSPDNKTNVQNDNQSQSSEPHVPNGMGVMTINGSATSSTPVQKEPPRPKTKRSNASDSSTNAKIKQEQRPAQANTNGVTKQRRPSMDLALARKGTTTTTTAALAAVQSQPYGSFGNTSISQQHATYSRPTIQTAVTTPSLHGLSLTSPYTQSPISALSYNHMPQQQQHPIRPQQASNGSSAVFANPGSSAPSLQNNGIYTPHQGFPPFSLPPPSYPTMAPTTTGPQSFGLTSPPTSSSSNEVQNGTTAQASIVDQSMDSMQQTVPVFGGDTYNRSPFTITDDFAAWLFGDQSFNFSSFPQTTSSFDVSRSAMAGGPIYINDLSQQAFFPSPAFHHPMSVTSIIAPPSPPQESLLSEHKRQELVDIIETYPESQTAFQNNVRMGRESSSDDDAVLSLVNMQLYISMFWQHFHPQLPILHKPTFVADKTPNLLLLSIIAVGGSCVDRNQDPVLSQNAAELSTLICMNLRWQIFDNSDFRPPAKLWVFQALLLLETYEKMYSTRQLHERAHIHHATSLTLMRRGSSLQGRCALDSPPSVRDDKRGSFSVPPPSANGDNSGNRTPDEWWNRWIVSEATKRCAFAAFVLDSVHATMFGHSAVMVAHEMRLALPCDEALWAATSSAEVGRVEQTLHNAGVKPTNFLDGLKRTLNGQTVKTNSFGRTIIMAGLLSVSWHMNQRDLQVSSLGVVHALGGRDKWRGALTRAFDLWKVDFDASLARIPTSATGSSAYDGIDYFLPTTEDVEHENIFESRTVLHHLAHMAMHVDIVDLQIYAGARRLLGRSIGGSDSRSAQRRMKDWAQTARARDATYYALQFLRQVLLPAEGSQTSFISDENGMPIMVRKPPKYDESAPLAYCSRDDYLLNRPWVLYFATLIVWAYGYALDGPVDSKLLGPDTPSDSLRDMRRYLLRVGGVKSPDELSNVAGRNQNLGLLNVLKTMFGEMRWELLIEASRLLTQCVEISIGNSQAAAG